MNVGYDMNVREMTATIGYGFDIVVGLRDACNTGRCVVDMLNKPCPFVKELACKDVTMDDWLDVFREVLEDGEA